MCPAEQEIVDGDVPASSTLSARLLTGHYKAIEGTAV